MTGGGNGATRMMTLLIYALLLVAGFLLYVLSLWLGSRLVKAARASFGRALALAVVLTGVGLLAAVATFLLSAAYPASSLVATLMCLALQIYLSCLIVQRMMQTTGLRALLIWVFGLLASIATLAVALYGVRPYLLESFTTSTNGMAPTLVSWHLTAVCPHCGQAMFVPAPAPGETLRDHVIEQDRLGICPHCFRTSEPLETGSERLPPDRFLVNRLLTPQRWDLIVLRDPHRPSAKHVKRLVGLPGEEVFLRDGAVWVNGVKQTPPDSIAGLKYVTEIREEPIPMGTEDNPWRLREDEYAVLGDFSARSVDSRFWGPVAGSSIDGVVTIRYWPASRWHVWR